MRHSGFRVVVSKFNLLSCPQSARLVGEGEHIFKAHGFSPDRSEPVAICFFSATTKRSTPHHFDRIIVSHGLGNLSGAQ